MLDDVRRLLDADGLQRVPVIALSARTGAGVAELKAEIANRVAAKKMIRTRLEADLKAAATQLDELSGQGRTRVLPDNRVSDLEAALADAAGVPTVVDAVERSTRLRAGRATGWPVVSWLSRFKPDPLKRLHLDLGADGRQLTARARTSVPEATMVQRARVDTEIRALADDVSDGLGRPWVESIRGASISRLPDLNDRLDSALAGVDLGASRIPIWAGAVRFLQWVLILAALGGAGWTAALVASGTLGDAGTPKIAGVAAPLLLFVGGVALGVLLALVCRLLVGLTARARAEAADRRLRAAVHGVTNELVVEPLQAELVAYTTVRAGLAKALR